MLWRPATGKHVHAAAKTGGRHQSLPLTGVVRLFVRRQVQPLRQLLRNGLQPPSAGACGPALRVSAVTWDGDQTPTAVGQVGQ